MQNLPPSRAALLQHAKQAALQSGYCWQMVLQADQKLPCPSMWGWVRASDSDDTWQPLWSMLPDVAKCCP